jgi:molybdopterin molybdotransferase
MPEFFHVLTPDDARQRLFEHLPAQPRPETVRAADALDRVTFEPIRSPAALPAFARSTMDGYAVRAADTFGASASLPAYLAVAGEAPMGRAPRVAVGSGQAVLVHTGGMIPAGADAVVMVENTQIARENEIECVKAVAVGENVLRVGEDVAQGGEVLPAGHWLRPQDLGGLLALGIVEIQVAARPRVAILGSGDEVVPPEVEPGPGQIRDINSYTLAGQVARAGGLPEKRGIVPDEFAAMRAAAEQALAECDMVVLSAGSSVSVRDMTSQVIEGLGQPGVLVHGVALKPGKPVILAAAEGKPVIGLPGNPVSAMVCADLFVAPTIYRMQGCLRPPAQNSLWARLTRNLASAPGREDYVPARLTQREGDWWAEPVFGKSNLIFTLIHADGMLKIPLDANGVAEGERVEVRLF